MGGSNGFSVLQAKSRGYTISYEDEGTGPALVLVPGLFSCAADWRDRGYTTRFVSTHRVLAVDPLGHGHSDKPHEWEAYRAPNVAADIVAVLDTAGVERAAVWGYSRGAALAAQTAVEFPDRVDALIAGGYWLGATPDVVESFSSVGAEALSKGDWAEFWTNFGIALPEDLKKQYEENDPLAMSAVLTAGYKSGYTIDVSRIAAPTFLYRGADDVMGSLMPMDAETLGVEIRLVEGQDHPGAFYQSMETVLPLVVEHLDRVAGTPDGS